MATNEASCTQLVDNFGETPDILHHWFRFSVNRDVIDEFYQKGMSVSDIAQAVAEAVQIQVYQRLAVYQTTQHIVFPTKREPEKL